jgi:hypothetical protein
MNYKLIQLNVHSDVRGKLISLEALKNIPFVLKQIRFICNTTLDESAREQMLVAISGSCQFILEQGRKQIKVSIDRPDVALYTGKGMRCKLESFSKNCSLLILLPEDQ